MISGTHIRIRLAEADDAPFIHRLYVTGPPKAALLDARREMPLPATRDIREMLEKKDALRGLIYSIENKEGCLCGFCALRGLNYEVRYAEVALVFQEEGLYCDDSAEEAWGFLLERAFRQYGLVKVIALCLDVEQGLRVSLEQRRFALCGIQREALYAAGHWRDLATYVLHQQAYATGAAHDTVGNPLP